ncbi:hypothetical protein [Sinomonas sp. B1-1]|uniref:hypothetical protein n=1 Tax=Sinomonas sp. B1-1 TaxID=3141454 RepID=UPI003D2E0255
MSCSGSLAPKAQLVGIPVSPDGWDLEATEEAFAAAPPTVPYVMPDFQNPTGASLAPEGRERLARLADRHGTLLVADETTALLGTPVFEQLVAAELLAPVLVPARRGRTRPRGSP